jgi:CheY-like chemotaxis protein
LEGVFLMSEHGELKEAPLVRYSPQQLSTRISFVARGLRDLAVIQQFEAIDWTQPQVVGWLANPVEVRLENFPDSTLDMKCISFRCELQNLTESSRLIGPSTELYSRSRGTGKMSRMEYANIVPPPAESIVESLRRGFSPMQLSPQGTTHALLWTGLMFPIGKQREECVEEALHDISEIFGQDRAYGTTLFLRMPMQAALKAKRILIVDDEPSMRLGICEILTQAGYDCCEVSGGLEALALLDSGRKFELLIHDLLNPSLDGITLLRQAKRRCPELPVIVASAIDDKSAFDACIQTGAYAYLQKPLEIEEFLRTVSCALGNAVKLTNEHANIRKRTSEMSDEELSTALLTSEGTGLPSYTAFREEQETGCDGFTCVTYADMDDFKRLRRELGGSESVEPILLNAVGKYLREAIEHKESSIRAYHGGGDYFIFRSLNEAVFMDLIATVNQRLSKSLLIIGLPDGGIVKRIARTLTKQPESTHDVPRNNDDWRIEDLPKGSRIIGMWLDDGTIIGHEWPTNDQSRLSELTGRGPEQTERVFVRS